MHELMLKTLEIVFALLCRLYKNGDTQLLLAKIFSLGNAIGFSLKLYIF